MAKKDENKAGGLDILPKMSVKDLGADASQAKRDNAEVKLCRIYGIASSLIAKKDRNGEPIIGIAGNFEGVNYADGKKARSGVLYLPGGIHEQLIDAVNTGELDANDKPVYSSVRFALEIRSVPSTNPHGYTFKGTFLIDSAEDDPLDALAAELPELPALPAS